MSRRKSSDLNTDVQGTIQPSKHKEFLKWLISKNCRKPPMPSAAYAGYRRFSDTRNWMGRCGKLKRGLEENIVRSVNGTVTGMRGTLATYLRPDRNSLSDVLALGG
jgi:hypothetical protein